MHMFLKTVMFLVLLLSK